MPSANGIAMLRAARMQGIGSREEPANLMAQLGHESGGFARLEEGFRYTRGIDAIPVRSAFREGRGALETARLDSRERNAAACISVTPACPNEARGVCVIRVG